MKPLARERVSSAVCSYASSVELKMFYLRRYFPSDYDKKCDEIFLIDKHESVWSRFWGNKGKNADRWTQGSKFGIRSKRNFFIAGLKFNFPGEAETSSSLSWHCWNLKFLRKRCFRNIHSHATSRGHLWQEHNDTEAIKESSSSWLGCLDRAESALIIRSENNCEQ